MGNAIQLLKASRQMLKNSERKVADYILNHQEELVYLTVSELAGKSGTSEATVIRMCRSLQFSGFKQFKLAFATAWHDAQAQRAAYLDVKPVTSTAKAIETVIANNFIALEQTLIVLKEEQIDRVIEALQQARKIVVIGMGASGNVALHFEQKLKRINVWCEAVTDFHAQLVAVSNVGERDVVFAISYSGETKEVNKVMQLAQNNGATTVSVTRYSNNSLQKIVAIALFAASTEHEIRTTATSSTISLLTVLDIVYTSLVAKDFEQYVVSLNNTRETIRKFVK